MCTAVSDLRMHAKHFKKASPPSRNVRLKGQCHEIFCFWFFHESVSPPAPEYPIRTVSNFFENSQRYSQVKVHHRYQRHQWQIKGTISGCWDLRVNLKAKVYLWVNSTSQRCPNKIIKTFMIEDFFHLPPVLRHRWCTLSCEYLREFSKKFETALILYSGAWEKLIHEKNPEVENLVTPSL